MIRRSRTWNPLPTVELGTGSPKGRAWETARYRYYCAFLARRPIGETIALTAFLTAVTPAS
jgi:hypothetical protein